MEIENQNIELISFENIDSRIEYLISYENLGIDFIDSIASTERISVAEQYTDKNGKTKYHPKITDDEVMSVLTGLLEKFKFIGFSQEIYYWNNLYWKNIPKDVFCSKIMSIYRACGWRISTHKTKEIHSLLYYKVLIESTGINRDKYKIPLLNGYYNINSSKLELPDPGCFFTYYFNFILDDLTYQKPEKFEDFFFELIPDPAQRNLFGAFLIYSMTTSLDCQKMILMIGKPRVGKTVLTNLINEIFQGNIENIHLQDIPKKHATASIVGKLLNVGSDLSDEMIKDISKIRDLITDQNIDIRPLYKPHTTVKNITKHIYTANFTPPLNSDAGESFYRRLLFIETTDIIKKINPYLTKELIDDKENIVQYLIKNYITYLDKLIIYNEPSLNQKNWFRLGISAYRFVYYNCCLCYYYQEIDVSELYSKYKRFCKMQDYGITNPVWFSRRLGDIGIEHIRKYVDGETIRIFQGIQIKDNDGKYPQECHGDCK